ncbi:hypothetical protein GCM10022630_34330 [Thermobifida alba]
MRVAVTDTRGLVTNPDPTVETSAADHGPRVAGATGTDPVRARPGLALHSVVDGIVRLCQAREGSRAPHRAARSVVSSHEQLMP